MYEGGCERSQESLGRKRGSEGRRWEKRSQVVNRTILIRRRIVAATESCADRWRAIYRKVIRFGLKGRARKREEKSEEASKRAVSELISHFLLIMHAAKKYVNTWLEPRPETTIDRGQRRGKY